MASNYSFWEDFKDAYKRAEEITRINEEREKQGLEPLSYKPEGEEGKPLDWVHGLIIMGATFFIVLSLLFIPAVFLVICLVYALLTYKS